MNHPESLSPIVPRLSRRAFIKAAAITTASVSVGPAQAMEVPSHRDALIDTNVALGQWPFRHVSPDDTLHLIDKLRKQGVTQAWVASLDSLLHKDITSVNARLAEECRKHGSDFLIPFGCIDAKLSNWEDDLRRCDEVHHMAGIRLYPNYHGYSLNNPAFERLLLQATERNMVVQVSIIMEDERTIHPVVNVPPVDTSPLSKILKKIPNARLQLLNTGRTLTASDMESLAALGVYFEIAMLEGLCGVENLLKRIPMSNLCFGSYSPVFYFESARLKLHESELGGMQMRAICFKNALQLLNNA